MPAPRSINDLVERQGLSYESRQRAADEKDHAPAPPRQPWITVSRQLGSGGSELAHALATRLGWQLFDREIVARIAADSKTGESAVRDHDERPAGILQEQLSALIVPKEAGHAAYVDRLTRVIAEIARDGRAVILGRGANWFLDPARGVRLRVVAPEHERVRRLAERLGAGHELEAARKIRDADAAQRGFIRQSFGRDVDDPTGYDLVLNLGSLPGDVAAGIVVSLLRTRFPAATLGG
jgi:cytidylate kinase